MKNPKSYNNLPKPLAMFAVALAAYVSLAAILAFALYGPAVSALSLSLPSRESLLCALLPVAALFAGLTSWSAFKSYHNGAWQGPPPDSADYYGNARIVSEPRELKRRFRVWKEGEEGVPGIVVGGIGSAKDLLLVSQADHALVEGTTRAGKSTSVLIPTVCNLISCGGSFLALDPKGELYDLTAAKAAEKGFDVACVDFSNPSKSDVYNPLQPILDCAQRIGGRTPEGMQAEARALAETMFPKAGSGNPVWVNSAKILFAGLCCYVAQAPGIIDQQRHIGTVESLARMPQEDLAAIVEKLPPSAAKSLLEGVVNVAAETYSGFQLQLISSIAPFGDPSVTGMLCGRGVCAEDFAAGKTALYVRFSSSNSARDLLVTALVEQVLGGLRRIAEASLGGRLERDVWLILEELPQAPRIPSLAKACAIARSQGLHIFACIQDRSQLMATYGAEARAIMSNLKLDLYLAGDDSSTCKEISEALGTYTAKEVKRTAPVGPMATGRSTQSVAYHSVPLISPAQLRRWTYETGHLVMEHGVAYACSSLPISATWLGDDLGLDGREPDAAKRAELAPVREVRHPDPAPVWRGETSDESVRQGIADGIAQAAAGFDPRVM